VSSLRVRQAPMHPFPAVSVSQTLTGAVGLVDLWCCFYDENRDERVAAAAMQLMTPEETSRWSGFRFEKDRRMFGATRLLVRCVLSESCGVAPADWRFTAGPHGKPRLQAPETTPRLHFNLANTNGLVVCAVSVAHEVLGVDVERGDRDPDALAIAERYFSSSELSAIRCLPLSQQRRRFFQYWTLKECYIKANGWGLTVPLDRFSFGVGDDERQIAFESQLDSEPDQWRFSLFYASSNHVLAGGAKTNGKALSLRVTRADISSAV